MGVSDNVTGTLRAQEHGHPPIVFEPGAASRLGGHFWQDEPTGALRADMGDNQLAVAIPINTQVGCRNHKDSDGTGLGVANDGDPAYTLQSAHSHAVAVYDARGNGDGTIVNTITGNHNNRITDYTALVMNERQYALPVCEDVANTLTGTDFKGTQCVFEPKTLKIRCGCEGGGKGALIQDNLSATLSASNDQTLFAPQAFGICAKDSNSMKSPNPNSGFYEADTTRTLDQNGGNPSCNQGGMAVVAFCQNQRDEVRDLQGRAGALAANPGAKQQTYVLQGSMIGRGEKNGPQGDGVSEEVSFTLNTMDRHSVCYQDTVGSLCASDDKFPQQKQIGEGRAIVEQVAVENHQHSGYRESKVSRTLAASGGTNGGGSECLLIENRYIVRRLTPTECAKLQGFPEVVEIDINMTRDEWIVTALAAGHILTDVKNGEVYRTRGSGGRILNEPEKLDGTILPSGYRVVSIKMGGHKKQCRVNRIIATAAWGLVPEGLVVDHINNDKLDNRVCNLQIISPKANSQKAHADGLYLDGDDSPKSKVSTSKHKEMAMLYHFGKLRMSEIAKRYGLSESRIQQIIRQSPYAQGLGIDEPSEDDLLFWEDVWETHRNIMGTSTKPKSRKQIIKWLKDPHSDSAEYKLWGNGVALPCVVFVLGGIVWSTREDS